MRVDSETDRPDRKRPARLGPVAFTGASMLVAQMVGVAIGILTARLLGPSAKGQAAAITTWSQTLVWVSTFGLNTAIAVRVAESFTRTSGPGQLATALGNSLAYATAVGASVAVLSFVLLSQVLAHLGPGTDLLLLLALVGIPGGVLVSILISMQVSIGRPSRLAAAQIMGPLVTIGYLGLVLASGRRLTPVHLVVAALVATSTVLYFLGHGLPWGAMVLDKAALRADLRFGGSTAAGGILSLLNLRLDILVLSIFVSTRSLGFYFAANNMMGPLLIAPLAAAAHLTPRVADLRDAPGTERLIFRQAFLYSGVSAAVGGALALAAPVAIPWLLGRAYRPAVVLTWLLIPGFVARAFAAVLVAGANGQRRARVGNLAEGAAAIVTIAGLPVALPRYGVTGAALVSTAAYIVSAAIAASVLWRSRPTDSALSRSPQEHDSGDAP
jgi:O-antigen/teichoic acid export membrane protein